MIELKGKFTGDCKVFAETVENEAIETIQRIIDNPAFDDAKVRVMPDCHQGKGIVIGFTCPVGKHVNPSHIGVDIGCSMTTLELSNQLMPDEYVEFERKVRESVPTGFNIHHKKMFDINDFLFHMNFSYHCAVASWPEMITGIDGGITEKYIEDMLNRIGMNKDMFYNSIGTVGGGNHFIEYGETDDNRAFVTVHCGSRNFGVKVANYWQKIADKNNINNDELKLAIEHIKTECSDRTRWKDMIDNAKQQLAMKNVPGYLTDENLKGYLKDMVIAQTYAEYNHKIIRSIIEDIFCEFGIKSVDEIHTIHNYISFEDHIIRKGAIRSYVGRRMIIPFNMRDGLAICEGKSNPDWNYSAPHGAGRIMSRMAARKNIDIKDFENSMKGIYSTCVGEGTLDESPMAYKNKDEIIRLIEPTAKVLYFVKPKINIKAVDSMDD